MAAANMEGIEHFTKTCGDTLSQEDAVQMVRGIQTYQKSDIKAPDLKNTILWQQRNGTKLIKPSKQEKHGGGRPLILIPSLINKSNIFDLSEQDSIMRWLQKNKINAILFDWGNLEDDETIETLIENRLNPALEYACDDASENEIDVLGYCMGGTLFMENFEKIPVKIRRIIALAAPWDFKVESSKFSKQVRIWSPMALSMMQKRRNLPAQWIQALFASIDPKGSARKFVEFSKMDPSSTRAQKFITVEDWLNDGVDIPHNIAHHCIQKWFIKNDLCQKKITMPGTDLLIVASNKDKLVPFDCAEALTKNITNARTEIQKAQTGHIGLIAGKNAQQDVWVPIKYWLRS